MLIYRGYTKNTKICAKRNRDTDKANMKWQTWKDDLIE